MGILKGKSTINCKILGAYFDGDFNIFESWAFSICRTLLYIPLSRKLAADVILYNRVDFLSLIADLLWTCHPDTLDNLENCRTNNHENEECY